MSASRTTTMASKGLGGADLAQMRQAPKHPGEVFEEEFRKPSGITQAEAARRMRMTKVRLNQFVRGNRSVTAENAVRLAALTGTSAMFWMNLQANHDLWHALRAVDTRDIESLTA